MMLLFHVQSEQNQTANERCRHESQNDALLSLPSPQSIQRMKILELFEKDSCFLYDSTPHKHNNRRYIRNENKTDIRLHLKLHIKYWFQKK